METTMYTTSSSSNMLNNDSLKLEDCTSIFPLLDEMDKKCLKILDNNFERKIFSSGECVFADIKEMVGLGIIVRGQIELKTKDATGKYQPLRILKAGDYFGDMSIENDGKRLSIHAYALAAETLVLMLSAEKASKLFKQHPEIRMRLGPLNDKAIRMRLSNIAFLQNIPEVILHQLCWMFQFGTCKMGTVVCRQNTVSEGFYLIVKGSLEVTTRYNDRQESLHLCTLGEGDMFGEISLIEKVNRTADVKALSECQFLFISADNFHKFMAFFPEIKPSFDDIIKHRTISSLKNVALFNVLMKRQIGPVRRFDDEKLSILGNLLKFESFKAGEVLFDVGELEDAIYIVLSGKTTSIFTRGDNEIMYSHDSNDCIGEEALFSLDEDVRRVYRCIAQTDLICLKLSSRNFKSFLQVDPAIKDLLKHFSREKTTSILEKIPLFQNIKENRPWCKMSLITSMFKFKYYAKNQAVFNESDIGDTFYIVLSGKIEESRKIQGERIVLRTIGSESFFGESALYTCNEDDVEYSVKRGHMAVCVEDSVLLALNRVEYHKLLNVAPEMNTAISSYMEARTANHLREIALFQKIKENKPWSKTDLISSMFRFQYVAKDTVLCEEGESFKHFYIILEGSFNLHSTLETTHAELHKGHHFGQPASQDKKTYKNTAVALENSLLLSSDNEGFESMLGIAPEIKEELF